MTTPSSKSVAVPKPYILGRKSFVAISAVEGLKLSRAGEIRLKKTGKLAPAKRRAEVIRAYKASKAL